MQQQSTPTYAAVVSNSLDVPHGAQTSSPLQAEDTIEECRACAQPPTWAIEQMNGVRAISQRNSDAIAELLVLLQALKDSALCGGPTTGPASGVLVSKGSGRSLRASDPGLMIPTSVQSDAAELLAYADSRAAELQQAVAAAAAVEQMLVQTLAQSVGVPCDLLPGDTSWNAQRGESSNGQGKASTAHGGLRSKKKGGSASRRRARTDTGRVRGAW